MTGLNESDFLLLVVDAVDIVEGAGEGNENSDNLVASFRISFSIFQLDFWVFIIPFFFKDTESSVFGIVSDGSVIPKTFLILLPSDCLLLIGSLL